jgi:Uma2 family endonuclease
MSHHLAPAPPFRYGWRYVTQTGPDGQCIDTEIPLTLEDVLHPLEGDVIPENTQHDLERTYLAIVARARVAGRDDALILSDCLIDWGVPGVRPMSPDLAPVFGVRDPERRRGTFRVVEEGAAPCLVVEIVSPDTRTNDTERKLELYHRVRVPWYILVDQEGEDGPRRLIAYRYAPDEYVEEPPDAEGRVLLEPLGIRLGLRDERLVCYDAASGKELGDYTRVAEDLAAAEQRAQDLAMARQDAERRAQDAERRAADAEQRIRELEAQIQLRQSNGPPPA